MLVLPLLLVLAGAEPQAKAQDKPLPDPQHLLDMAFEGEKRQEEQKERYDCKVHTELVITDSKGHVKKSDIKDEEQFYVNGHEIDRLLARNGKPLDEKETRHEDEVVRKEAIKFSDPSQRVKGEDESQQQAQRALRMVRLSDERRGTVNGRSTIFFHVKGDPDAKPKDLEERWIQAADGTLAVDEATGKLLDLDIKTDKDVKIGGGLVGDIHKGVTFHIRRAPQPDGIWLLESVEGSGDGRAALFFHLFYHLKQTNGGCQLYTVGTTQSTDTTVK